jgi:hypothetical protein
MSHKISSTGRYRINREEGFISFLGYDFTKSHENLWQMVTFLAKYNECAIHFVLYRNHRTGHWMGSPWDRNETELVFHDFGTLEKAEAEALRYCKRQRGG